MSLAKPAVLYHASQNRNVTVFEPRAETIRDPNEGPVVFATPDIRYASCFLVKTDDSWTTISNWGPNHPWAFICSDKQRFTQADKGGAIYTLPSETFDFDPEAANLPMEMVSKVSVKPTASETYESGLEAMLKYDVQVFFVTKEEFGALLNSDDHGLNLLIEWQKTHRLENRNRGLAVTPLLNRI